MPSVAPGDPRVAVGEPVSAVTRPVLRYHGGKWLLAPWIMSHFPAHRVYVEPFGGAGSVLLRKPRSYAEVYNDRDGEIVSLFRVLRDPIAALRLTELLRLTPFSRAEFRLSYEPAGDVVEQARRTVVRAFLGFGSPSASGRRTGFRSNSHRNGNGAASDWANLPAALSAVTDRLRGVVVEERDACAVLRQHDSPETLCYADPPYPQVTRTTALKGYRHELTDDDHRELAAVLRSLAGMVVLSGYPCDLYDRDLYPDWHRVERHALADGARKRTEVLWLNPACAEALERERAQGVLPMGAA